MVVNIFHNEKAQTMDNVPVVTDSSIINAVNTLLRYSFINYGTNIINLPQHPIQLVLENGYVTTNVLVQLIQNNNFESTG